VRSPLRTVVFNQRGRILQVMTDLICGGEGGGETFQPERDRVSSYPRKLVADSITQDSPVILSEKALLLRSCHEAAMKLP